LLKKEIGLYEATCTLTPNLKMLLDALLTIRPTSTQNEKFFCLEYLPRNKDQNYQIGKLMLCVF
jgi:hypothetical protein